MNQDRRNRVKSLIMGGSSIENDRRSDVQPSNLTAAKSRDASRQERTAEEEHPQIPDAQHGEHGPTQRTASEAGENSNLASVKTSGQPLLDPSTPPRKAPSWATRMTSGPVRGLHVSLHTAAEGSVVELDTTSIDPSMVVDRIADTGDQTFPLLVDSVRERGQQVPILVRPHPTDQARYQIAYGHRRWRAATVLGLPVRAIVRTLSDDELVVAQGKENLERRDLSYIERALFARRMEGQGFKRDTICAAMATVDSEVSRYIAVAASVPESLIAAIGPAPKVGRPRWLAFADRLKKVGLEAAEVVVKEPGFGDKPTNERFAALQAALAPKSESKPTRPKVSRDVSGRKFARYEETPDRFSLTIDRRIEPSFGRYLFDQLPEILAAYKAREANPDSQPEQEGDEKPE